MRQIGRWFADPAGLGGRLGVREPERGVRGLHGGVRRGDAVHAAGALVRRARRRLGRVRGRHRRQLLPHLHHTRAADHARKVHQRLRPATAHSGHGQPNRTTSRRSVTH